MSLISTPRRRWYGVGAFCCAATFALLACSGIVPKEQPLPAPVAVIQTYHYAKDIQPIFDSKCAACHGCYDAPCQLKLTSADGVERGASKLAVYDGTRLERIPTTRLGIDALNVGEWRQKGFYSVQPVLQTEGKNQVPSALLQRALAMGRENSWPPNRRLPEDLQLGFARVNQCPTLDEYDSFAKKHPREGMPLAVTGLTEPEYQTLSTWISQGAVVEPNEVQPSAAEAEQITQWENWLNREGDREQLVARYLYEHLFTAHLHFTSEKTPHFYELLRSRTPSGEAIVPVATRLPNQAPDGPFHYRLRILTESIVQKNHITYGLDARRMAHFQDLFLKDAWTVPPKSEHEKHDKEARANPFLTFDPIPAKARYQFMLDEAQYFVRTFIRGPVCAGQAATDVIRDQFWVSFEDPSRELYVNDAAYRKKVSPLLDVAGQDSSLIKAGTEWASYRNQRNDYVRLRQEAYAKKMPKGASISDIWDGDGTNRDALLTVFRHHDNAFVKNGLIGAMPETLWVMDYPLFERTFYELVVNFDVFGNVSHQLQTRLYFDLIRNDGETDFLRFLPPKLRNPLLHQWYQDGGRVKLFTTYPDIDDKRPTQLKFKPGIDVEAAKAAYVDQLLKALRKVKGPDDVINRCARGDCKLPDSSAMTQAANRALRPLAQATGKTLPVLTLLPEVVLLRIRGNQQRLVYSLVHNRAHSNVAFIMGEEGRLQPERDTVSVMPGVYGNYPNFAFDVPMAELDSFVTALSAATDKASLEKVVDQWGLRRTHPDFWAVFNDFSQYQRETEPLEAGILDMNRFENL
ncbi:fatty acid cis/trans isomerase [Nevskia sp.]|uniref:fatty acid cis/trans isomerase n=1 Tax=Nevskia sp. TaxID=1929292 RepID=UPI0025CC0A48|nr:fatty acid cis/trans isomerase [Nevskia sp.]